MSDVILFNVFKNVIQAFCWKVQLNLVVSVIHFLWGYISYQSFIYIF